MRTRARMRSSRGQSVVPQTQFTAAAAAISAPLRHPPARPSAAPLAPAATATELAPPATDEDPDYDNPQWRLSHAGMQKKATSSIWFALLAFGLPAVLIILAAALQGK